MRFYLWQPSPVTCSFGVVEAGVCRHERCQVCGDSCFVEAVPGVGCAYGISRSDHGRVQIGRSLILLHHLAAEGSVLWETLSNITSDDFRRSQNSEHQRVQARGFVDTTVIFGYFNSLVTR